MGVISADRSTLGVVVVLTYVIRRVVAAIVVVWLIATGTFFLMYSLPGAPFIGEKPLPPVVLENLQVRYGLGQPLARQYRHYLLNLLQGDLGPSYIYQGRSVNQLLAEAFPYSALLGILALVVAFGVGIPLGVWGALAHRWGQQMFLFFTTFGIALPNLVVAPLMLYFFALRLGWFSAALWGGPRHLVLPVSSLALLPTALVARLVRSSMRTVLQQPYLQTARAKGLGRWTVLWRHALPNALIPVLAYLGPLIAGVLTGSFVVEQIFALPGLGAYFVAGILQRDYGLLMGVTLFYTTVVVVLNLAIDLVSAWLDPRFATEIVPVGEVGG